MIVEKANDFAALVCFESLLTLLSKQGCNHYIAFGQRDYKVNADFLKDVCPRRNVVARWLVKML